MSDAETKEDGDLKPSKKKNKPAKKSSALRVILLVIISLVLIVFTKTTYIFIVLMLLPAMVAYFVDKTDHRSNFHTIFACNLAGLLPYVMDIIARGSPAVAMMDALGDVYVWFVIYASAGFGYLLVWGCPKVASGLVYGFNAGQIQRIEQTQKKLIDEWGPEIEQQK